MSKPSFLHRSYSLLQKDQIGRLHGGAFDFRESRHAAHHILQAVESFLLQQTRRERAAITAAANHRHRQIFAQAGNPRWQLWQRNMSRPSM